jgi:hypothetical protein
MRSFGEIRLGWKDHIKMDINETGVRVWAGFIWLRIGTSGGQF